VENEERIERERKSNRDPEMLVEEQIGKRTFSRLMQMCGDPIILRGADGRLAA
jgi:hypothetical protein